MPTPLLIDCDPGTDDAIALAAAAASPELNIEAVTTVAGNQTLRKTTQNARAILEWCDAADVPVHPGLHEPLVRNLETADEVHGRSGLADLSLPEPPAPSVEEHAVDVLWERARATGGCRLLAVGPLTNVAVALRRHPELPEALEEIVLMGGSITGGNVTPVAEFNIYTDPEAAQIVFNAPVSVTMVGLDVTRAARLDADATERIRAIGGAVPTGVAELLDHLLTVHEQRYGWASAPVHDALAALSLIDPALLETMPMHVAVERSGEYSLGQTVCDQLGTTERAPNVDVATAVDAERFETLLIDLLSGYRSVEQG